MEWPVASILLGYLLNGLIGKAWHLVVLVSKLVMVYSEECVGLQPLCRDS